MGLSQAVGKGQIFWDLEGPSLEFAPNIHILPPTAADWKIPILIRGTKEDGTVEDWHLQKPNPSGRILEYKRCKAGHWRFLSYKKYEYKMDSFTFGKYKYVSSDQHIQIVEFHKLARNKKDGFSND